VNKAQLIEALAERFNGNKREAAQALDSVLDAVTRRVASGDKVGITGFGTFEKIDRPARMVRNPRTGEKKRAKKSSVAKFRMGAGLKAAVNGAKKAPAVKKATAVKTTSAKKTATKAAPAKSAVSKSTATKTTATKSAPVKKSVAKAAPAKKTPAAKKLATKNTSAAKKSTAAKTLATKAPARKATAKRTAKKS
jgi:DNA-binding protein HU-beta